MPGALVADQMGLGKPLALVAVAMISQLLTEKIVMWLLQTIIWRNTLEEWVDMGQTYHPGIIGEDEEWIPLQRLNSAPRRRQIKIHTTPPDWHPVLTLTVEPILVVTMPGVADTFKSVIEEMTYGTNFKVLYLLHMENVNLTHEDLNSSIDEPEIWLNIHLVSYDTISSGAKPLSNSQLSYCSWTCGIFDKSHQYKTKNSVGWQIAIRMRISFKLQVTATLGFHWLYDWCYQRTGQFSGTPEDLEDDTVEEEHGAEALYVAVKISMHVIREEDNDAQ